MITEDYVSLETAKFLKERGFNEICEAEYGAPNVNKDYYILQRFFTPIENSELIDDAYTAPTLQMAMKWLREVHKIFISIQQHMDMSYVWYIYEDGAPKGCDRESHNNTYEEACEAAIKYCLENLI